MADSHTTTTFGASVVPTSHPSEKVPLPPATLDSPALTPAVSQDNMSSDYLEKPVPPHSPFYQHPPASVEGAPAHTPSKSDASVYEKDPESGHLTPLTGNDDTNPFSSKINVGRNQECKMWPSKQTLLQRKLAEKRQRREKMACRGCAPVTELWAKFDRRQRLLTKIAMALFLVGAIVAVAVGITKAVNGGVYAGDGNSHAIGSVGK